MTLKLLCCEGAKQILRWKIGLAF